MTGSSALHVLNPSIGDGHDRIGIHRIGIHRISLNREQQVFPCYRAWSLEG